MERFIRQIGSLGMAVALLLAIGAVLAYGTFYETRFGTAAVQRFVYQSWWFKGLLAFLAMNLATAAWRRYPWERKHIPFVLAHIGIILILTGAIVGGSLGVEGQMLIPEGRTSSTLRLTHNVLTVHQPNPGIHHTFRTHFDAAAWNQTPNATYRLSLKDRLLTLLVDRYYPDAQRGLTIANDNPVDNPALHVAIFRGEQRSAVWLFSRDPHRFGARFGQIHFLFIELPSQKAWRRMILEKRFPGNSLILALHPLGRLAALVTDGRANHHVIDPVRVQVPYPHPEGFSFQVAAFYPRARQEVYFTNQGSQVRQEALHIVARYGEDEGQGWVSFGEPLRLGLGEDPLLVEYHADERLLPFSVKLLDFRREDYPGTQTAASFESDVEVTDPHTGISFQRTIRMNQPLKYKGFSLYQSSYIPGLVETTVLSVRKDPGTPLVYLGFLIVVAGVVCMFIFRRTP